MRRIRWAALVLLTIAFRTAMATAQEAGELRCEVFDSTTDAGIGGVIVTLKRDGEKDLKLGITDSNGRLTKNVAIGKVEISFSKAGYIRNPRVIAVEVRAQASVDAKAKLINNRGDAGYYKKAAEVIAQRVKAGQTTYTAEWERMRDEGLQPYALGLVARTLAGHDGDGLPRTPEFGAYAALDDQALSTARRLYSSRAPSDAWSRELYKGSTLPDEVKHDTVRIALAEQGRSTQQRIRMLKSVEKYLSFAERGELIDTLDAETRSAVVRPDFELAAPPAEERREFKQAEERRAAPVIE